MKIVDRQPLRASLIVSILFGAFSIVIYNFYADFRQKEFLKILKQNAISRERLLADSSSLTPQILERIEINSEFRMTEEANGIYTLSGKTIYASPTEQPISPDLLRKVLKKKEVSIDSLDKDRILFIYEIPETSQKVILSASAIDDFGYAKQERLRDLLIVGTIVAIIVIVLMMRFFVKRDVKPIGRIADRMELITAHDSNQRLPEANLNDEVGQMARTFNDLLDRLEFAYTQQRNFVSYVTHELRTPLTIMQGQAEVALMKERTNNEYRQVLDSAKAEVQDMIKLVNELLELVRVNADAHLVDLREVRVDDLLWQARGQLIQKKPHYDINIDFEEVPESEDITVMGNAALLKMAFMNIMENACKYSLDPSCQTLIHTRRKEVEVRFIDQGTGISEEDLEHIFKPFYRSVNTHDVSGHGIGLPLTKRIIEIHRGKISIESEVGHGSTIIIILPTIE
ncbi:MULTISPECIES: cell wall metabolism sensor histidine kinase WalK [Emticicia]|uniref:sensor histidine kinase n=1 Tax=Emticicia TaxID=312278 RepID=UPI000C760B64|nr:MULTISPECIES: ATP-binding protein [Emticicia]PLK45353.1 two-component sensor histidine kinase [Emticicia sp. TH156]UTA69696.1 ATP-binding protein [Emticicia sp. 21SJ11W-3]